MQLGLTAINSLASVKNLVDISSLSTALVLIEATRLDLGGLRMVPAVTHLSDRIVFLAAIASDEVEIGPDLPVDFFPTNSEGFTDESNELLQVPVPINHVLGAHLSVSINGLLTVGARQYFPLLL